MTDKITKGYQLDLSVNDKGFNAGTAKAAKASEKLADGIEKVEKGASRAFGKKLPLAASASKKSFGELSKSAQKLRDRIEEAGKTQTAKEFRKLRVEVDKLESEVRKAGKSARPSFNKINKGATSARPSVLKLKNSIGGLESKLLGLGSVAAAGFAFKELVSSSLELEKATAEVSTIVDTAKVNVGSLSAEVRDMAGAFGIDGVDATKALYQAISAGVEPAKAVGILKESATLATAGIATMEESVDLVTSTLNAYGLEADKAGAVSDSFFQTVKDGKTKIPELAASIGKVAPLASNAGVSLVELNAGIATLTATGLSTSESVTGLQQIIKAFVKPTEQSAAAAAKLGINFNATELASKGLEGVMAELKGALKDANDRGEDTTEIMASLFGRVEGANAALTLAGAGFDKFNKSLDNGKNSMGSTREAAQKMNETVGVKLNAAYQAAKEQVLEFGKQILKGLDALVDYAGGAEGVKEKLFILRGAVQESISRFSNFVGGTKGAEQAVTGFGLAVKGTFGLVASIIRGKVLTAQAILDGFSVKTLQAFNKIKIFAKEVELLKARATFDDSTVVRIKSEIQGLQAANEDLERTYKKTSAARRIEVRKNELAERKSLKELQGALKSFEKFYEGMNQKITRKGRFLSTLGGFANSAASFIAGNIPGLGPQRNSVGSDLGIDRDAATQRAIEKERLADLRRRIKEDEKFYQEQLRIQKEADKEAIRQQKASEKEILRLQREEERERRRILSESGQSTRRALGGSLAQAFRGGIADAAPDFRRALARTLSASAQPGISFRGSSLQAGQGTRQQLQNSLFNRQATGRQLATNIQLLAAGFSSGGTVPGVDQGRDSVLAPLRPGEEVIRPEAARPNRELLKAINRSRGPIVLPRRSDNSILPGRASSGSDFFSSGGGVISSVSNDNRTTNNTNRSTMNVRGGINVSVPGVNPKEIASAVMREIRYKMRRGLMDGGAL